MGSNYVNGKLAEIKKIIEVIQNSQDAFKKNEIDIYALLKIIRNSSDILKHDVDIMINEDKLFFSKIHKWHHLRLWGKENIAKHFLKGFSKPILYHDGTMDKSCVSDFIEDGSLVCISENYLKDYVFDATSQHNGLRKQALIKILNLLEEINLDKNLWIKELWEHVKKNKELLIEKFHTKASNGILWLSRKYIRKDIEAKGEYFIAFESQWVNQCLDNDFCEILQDSITEKSLEHIIDIHKG